jgi:hypothetical protein
MKKSIPGPASALHVVGDINVTGNINTLGEAGKCKALESLAGGAGEILALLSLQ